MADRIFTYKQIPNNCIDTYWSLNDYFVQFEKGEYQKKLPGWQKNDDVAVTVEFYLKQEDIKQYLRMDRSYSFFVQYHSKADKEGTSIQDLLLREPFSLKKSNYVLSGIIPGDKIAGVLEVSLSLCVDGVLDDMQSLNPDISLLAADVGSILFESSISIILEGEMSYFPVADIDFGKYGYPANALYFLERNRAASLDTSFSTAYRLYFNNTHPQFNRINDIKESESRDYLLNMIVYDVYKQLIFNALEDDSFVPPDEDDPENHSVRFVYARLINQIRKYYFSNVSFDTLKKMAHSEDPSTVNKFLCALQSFLLTFGDK